MAPALIGAFGDAFVEGSVLEGASLLAWSHAVLDLALRRALREQTPFLAGGRRGPPRLTSDDMLPFVPFL